ncbi:hypothetical protein EMCRGX_G007561 [Ephydatia muelleri]
MTFYLGHGYHSSLRSKDGSGPQEDDLIICLASQPNMFPSLVRPCDTGAEEDMGAEEGWTCDTGVKRAGHVTLE